MQRNPLLAFRSFTSRNMDFDLNNGVRVVFNHANTRSLPNWSKRSISVRIYQAIETTP